MNLSQLPFFGRLKLTDREGRAIPGSENLGAYLKEAFGSVVRGMTNFETQSGFGALSPPMPPPNIQRLTVQAANGHFQVAIQDQSAGVGRATKYFVEHADNPAFTNAHVEDIGSSRNKNLYLGNVTRYFRAYSANPSSGPSGHVYHGSRQTPTPVTGGGTDPGPSFLPSQGSGTSAQGQPGFGPGPILVRTENNGFQWQKQRPGGTTGNSGGVG